MFIDGADAGVFPAHMPTALIHLPIPTDNKTRACQWLPGKYSICIVLTPPITSLSRRARPRHGSGLLHNHISRRRQENKMERRYANPLSRYWGMHLQKEYNPSDSLTEADHDDDIESPSSGASSSPLSSTLPSSHGQPQSNS